MRPRDGIWSPISAASRPRLPRSLSRCMCCHSHPVLSSVPSKVFLFLSRRAATSATLSCTVHVLFFHMESRSAHPHRSLVPASFKRSTPSGRRTRMEHCASTGYFSLVTATRSTAPAATALPMIQLSLSLLSPRESCLGNVFWTDDRKTGYSGVPKSFQKSLRNVIFPGLFD